MALEWKTLYWGDIKSIDAVTYRIYIEKNVDSAETVESKEIYFSSDCPAIIEWNEVDKLDPVQTSSLTLKVLSEEDREFIGLYSVVPGEIRACVYIMKNSVERELYWSGTLDTELYEEPFAYKDHYEVLFTFSDFAILDRMRWDLTGIDTIGDIIGHCLDSSNVFYDGRKMSVSTTVTGVTGNILQHIYVVNENFYDEDGDPMTMRKVLNEVLRPLALRLVQKRGNIYVYDLNSLYSFDSEEVWWKSTDQMLGADKIFNNVTISFSPYTQTKIIDGTLPQDEMLETSQETIYSVDTTYSLDGFRLRKGECTGQSLPITLGEGASFFRIDSVYSGNDEAGVAWVLSAGKTGYNYVCYPEDNREFRQALLKDGTMKSEEPVFTTALGFLANSVLERSNHKLKISLDVLMDVRYNPFEEASEDNEKDNYDYMKAQCNFGYIPVMLSLKDASGNVIYHYENNSVRVGSGYSHADCKWVEGEGSWGCMWLCYYNQDDRENGAAFDGWTSNKPIIGRYKKELPKKWEKMGDGEFIDMPPAGGYLELKVGRGVYQFDYQERQENEAVYKNTRWLMYKNPAVTLVDNNGKEEDYNDIVDSSWLIATAEEGHDVDTIIGTPPTIRTPFNARGCIMKKDFTAIYDFWRAGCNARLEELLINTIYSQYGKRHKTLRGTARILMDMKIYTDASSSGKYIILSEVQDLLQDTSEILMSELSEECYEPAKN